MILPPPLLGPKICGNLGAETERCAVRGGRRGSHQPTDYTFIFRVWPRRYRVLDQDNHAFNGDNRFPVFVIGFIRRALDFANCVFGLALRLFNLLVECRKQLLELGIGASVMRHGGFAVLAIDAQEVRKIDGKFEYAPKAMERAMAARLAAACGKLTI